MPRLMRKGRWARPFRSDEQGPSQCWSEQETSSLGITSAYHILGGTGKEVYFMYIFDVGHSVSFVLFYIYPFGWANCNSIPWCAQELVMTISWSFWLSRSALPLMHCHSSHNDTCTCISMHCHCTGNMALTADCWLFSWLCCHPQWQCPCIAGDDVPR